MALEPSLTVQLPRHHPAHPVKREQALAQLQHDLAKAELGSTAFWQPNNSQL